MGWDTVPDRVPHWLVKEEPAHYSFHEFQREGETTWTGVHNPLAQRHLQSMRRGDDGFYYHTGTAKAIVGLFRVVRAPRRDQDDPRGAYAVRLKAGRSLRGPIPLATLKHDPAFRQFDLVRNSRLSVMPVSATIWKAILAYETSILR